jgi:hypothetical protein
LDHGVRVLLEVIPYGQQVVEGIDAIQLFVSDVLA